MKRNYSDRKSNSSRKFNVYEMNSHGDVGNRKKAEGASGSDARSRKNDTRTLKDLASRLNGAVTKNADTSEKNIRHSKPKAGRARSVNAGFSDKAAAGVAVVASAASVIKTKAADIADSIRDIGGNVGEAVKAKTVNMADKANKVHKANKVNKVDMADKAGKNQKVSFETRSLKGVAEKVRREQRRQNDGGGRLYETRALYNLKSIDPSKKRKTKKQKRIIKPVAIIAGILVLLIGFGAIAYGFMFGGMKRTTLDDSDLGINSQELDGIDVEKIEGIMNIALFGIDTTEGAATIGDQYRSDCIIILSIDPDANEFKVTSILRDSKVPIEGYSPQKINSAYKYGGAKLAIKTLNQNFKMNIKDYVTVDFARMAEIIDMVGGLTIKITAAEAQNMMDNNIIDPVEEGTWLLDGAQCVAYARVRKVDSDFFRASRQQHVLTLLFNKIKKMPKSDYPSLINKLMKCVETSMSYSDIIKIANSMDLGNAKMVTNTIPDAQYEKKLTGGVDSTGSWVWEYNLDAAAARLHHIIYGVPYDETKYYGVEQETTASGGSSGNDNAHIDEFFGGGEVQQYDPSWEEYYTEEVTYEEIPSETYIEDETTGGAETGEGGGETENTETAITEEPVTHTTAETGEPATTSEEVVTDVTAEPVTEVPTEPVTEAPVEPVTEAPVEPVTEAPVEPITEAPTEPIIEAAT